MMGRTVDIQRQNKSEPYRRSHVTILKSGSQPCCRDSPQSSLEMSNQTIWVTPQARREKLNHFIVIKMNHTYINCLESHVLWKISIKPFLSEHLNLVFMPMRGSHAGIHRDLRNQRKLLRGKWKSMEMENGNQKHPVASHPMDAKVNFLVGGGGIVFKCEFKSKLTYLISVLLSMHTFEVI